MATYFTFKDNEKKIIDEVVMMRSQKKTHEEIKKYIEQKFKDESGLNEKLILMPLLYSDEADPDWIDNCNGFIKYFYNGPNRRCKILLENKKASVLKSLLISFFEINQTGTSYFTFEDNEQKIIKEVVNMHDQKKTHEEIKKYIEQKFKDEPGLNEKLILLPIFYSKEVDSEWIDSCNDFIHGFYDCPEDYGKKLFDNKNVSVLKSLLISFFEIKE